MTRTDPYTRTILNHFPVAGFVEIPAQEIEQGDTLDFGNGGRVTIAEEPQRFMGYMRFATTTGGRWMIRDDTRARVCV